MDCSASSTNLFQGFLDSAVTPTSEEQFKSILQFSLSDTEISSIQDELDILFGITMDDKEAKDLDEKALDPEGLSSIEKKALDVQAKVKARVQINADKEAGAMSDGKEALVAEGHIVQDSKEVLEIVEPISPDTMFTSPIDLQKASYSIAEDYPDTYGFVDTVKNWYKINKKKKYAEYVHASGSMMKMDRDGNTTIEIKGKLKFIQRGEMTHFIGDNLDISIDGDFYHHILGELKQYIDKDHSQTIGGNNTISVSGNMKTTATRIDLN